MGSPNHLSKYLQTGAFMSESSPSIGRGVADHGIPPNRFNPHCWITGEPEIGEKTWIGAFTLIDGLGGLKIGRGCDISSGVQILTHSTVPPVPF